MPEEKEFKRIAIEANGETIELLVLKEKIENMNLEEIEKFVIDNYLSIKVYTKNIVIDE